MLKSLRASNNLGQDTENIAVNFLEKKGLMLLERNFSCKFGEIDLIMRDGNSIIFVEVRLRNNLRYGDGASSVTVAKQKRIIKTAMIYLQANPRWAKLACRFDVLAARNHICNSGSDSGSNRTNSTIHIDWIKDAFQTNTQATF